MLAPLFFSYPLDNLLFCSLFFFLHSPLSTCKSGASNFPVRAPLHVGNVDALITRVRLPNLFPSGGGEAPLGQAVQQFVKALGHDIADHMSV